jgi:hypothetical protein
VLAPTRPYADTLTRVWLRHHTSGTSDNLELKGCPRLLKFPVLLFLLAILNQHRRLRRLHRSSLHRSSLHRLPRCRHRLVLFLRLNRCQHRLRSRGVCFASPPRLRGQAPTLTRGFDRPADSRHFVPGYYRAVPPGQNHPPIEAPSIIQALLLSVVLLARKMTVSERVHDPAGTFFSRFFAIFRSFYRARFWR